VEDKKYLRKQRNYLMDQELSKRRSIQLRQPPDQQMLADVSEIAMAVPPNA
jgi:hypothetical protein